MSNTKGISDFRRGDTRTIKITLTDKDNNPVNLTGSSIWFTLKKDINDDDSKALIQKEITTHTDPTNGKTEIVLTNTETNDLLGIYYYDIQLVDSGGNVTTLITSSVKVLPDVTRSV